MPMRSRSTSTRSTRSRRAPTTQRKRSTNTSSSTRENSQRSGFFELFVQELSVLLNAENQIIETLPQLVREATSSELKDALREHLKETRTQVERLHEVFRILGQRPRSEFCEGIAGILSEGNNMISQQRRLTKDVAIITAAQKVEHYEIAAYGSVKAHANRLDLDEVADLLDETLDEESSADSTLTKIAEGTIFTTGVNKLAAREEAFASNW